MCARECESFLTPPLNLSLIRAFVRVLGDSGADPKKMRALCALYQRDGYVSATYETRTHIRQGNDFAVADVAWRIEWQGKAPSTFNTTYNLARTPDGWRVLLCTAYSEQRLS